MFEISNLKRRLRVKYKERDENLIDVQKDFFTYKPVFFENKVSEKYPPSTILFIYLTMRNYIKFMNSYKYTGFLFQNIIYKNKMFYPFILNSRTFYINDHRFLEVGNDQYFLEISSMKNYQFQSIDLDNGIVYPNSDYYSLALMISSLLCPERMLDVCQNIKDFHTNEFLQTDQSFDNKDLEIYTKLIRFCKEATIFDYRTRSKIGSEIDLLLEKEYEKIFKDKVKFYFEDRVDKITNISDKNYFYMFINEKKTFSSLVSESNKDIYFSDMVDFLDFANKFQYIAEDYATYEQACSEFIKYIFIDKSINKEFPISCRTPNPFWSIENTVQLKELISAIYYKNYEIYFEKYPNKSITERDKKNKYLLHTPFIYYFYQIYCKMALNI